VSNNVADRNFNLNFKAPLQRNLLRGMDLRSGPSLSPPVRNPPVGQPGGQQDGRLTLNLRSVPACHPQYRPRLPPTTMPARTAPVRSGHRPSNMLLTCGFKAGGPATTGPARRAAARPGTDQERSFPDSANPACSIRNTAYRVWPASSGNPHAAITFAQAHNEAQCASLPLNYSRYSQLTAAAEFLETPEAFCRRDDRRMLAFGNDSRR